MNIAIVLSGGSGKRFGSNIPKQYLDLCGQPVIQYVIDNALNSKTIDEIVLVIDDDYLDFVDFRHSNNIHCVGNGKERLYSVKNALDHIKENYPECENIIITQAVSPFVTSDLIDKYINLLSDYDVVTTAQKCVGELFNIKEYQKIRRDDYYFCQSPEAFKFKDLYECIDTESEFSELIYHYKNEPKIYYYLDFQKNIKLTYKEDLDYATFLMNEKKRKVKKK